MRYEHRCVAANGGRTCRYRVQSDISAALLCAARTAVCTASEGRGCLAECASPAVAIVLSAKCCRRQFLQHLHHVCSAYRSWSQAGLGDGAEQHWLLRTLFHAAVLLQQGRVVPACCHLCAATMTSYQRKAAGVCVVLVAQRGGRFG